METREKIESLIAQGVEAGLLGMDFVQGLDVETVRESYNGIGPEFLRPSLREKVTQHFAIFAPAAVVHDLRNEFSDGTKSSFHAANREFLANCLKLVDVKYPPDTKSRSLRLKRDLARQTAYAFYKFVDGAPGWRAWLEAKERHEAKMASGNSAGERKEQT